MSELRGRVVPEPIGREAEYEAVADAVAAENTLADIAYGRAQGLRMAALVLGMWQGLEDCGMTREEKLAMIQAACHGH